MGKYKMNKSGFYCTRLSTGEYDKEGRLKTVFLRAKTVAELEELVAEATKETGDLFNPMKEPEEVFAHVAGIGPEKSASFVNWFRNEQNKRIYQHLREKLTVTQASSEPTGSKCEGLTFVITGDVHHYKNRNELKAYIESQGGKVASAVSGSTSFLINNDVTSTSGKNQKAQQLGIPIISEDQFVEQYTSDKQ